MNMNSDSKNMSPPVQQRSERTRDAYLRALERLLEQKDFEEISIADIAREAARSVGGFYTKFLDKEDLLKQLFQAYEQERAHIRNSSLGDPTWQELSLAATLHRLVHLTIHEFRTRRGLFRAYIQQQRSSKTPDAKDPALHPLYHLVYAILQPKAPHRTERETRFAFFVLTTVVSGAILFSTDTHARTLSLTDEQLADQCIQLLERYLLP
jgi:AcrR family transcriptional regulator